MAEYVGAPLWARIDLKGAERQVSGVKKKAR